MHCYSCVPFGDKAFLHGKGRALPTNFGPLRVSYNRRLEFLKVKSYPNLGSVDSLKVTTRLVCYFMSNGF